MRSPIPAHAERITLAGETAWIWQTEIGWTVFQWPYRFDLRHTERGGEGWHTIDWYNESPREGEFEGGLAVNAAGAMERAQFLEHAERIVLGLRRRNASPAPPAK